MSRKLQPYINTALAVVIPVVAFMLIWLLAGPKNVRNAQTAETAVQTVTAGTPGAAPTPAVTDRSAAETENVQSPESQPHWAEENGNTVHYNSAGEKDTGWTAIDGKGCYFDENGVYVPDRDASRLVALTFDDGPSPYTDQILDVLETYRVKASFMMLGVQVEKYGAVLPRMAALGNTLGNHSYSHAEMLDVTAEDVLWQFEAADQLIEAYAGERAKVVRFPYGDYTKELVAAVGKPQIYWDVDSLDWDSQERSAIQTEIWTQIQGGCIILMHDIYPETAAAVAELIPALLEAGYEPVNIEELAASRGYELKSGVTYFSFKDKNLEEGRVTDE